MKQNKCRIKDSLENLRRMVNNKINLDLNKKRFCKEEYKLSEFLFYLTICYDLFKSQILTLGIVMVGIIIMFFILLKY